MFLRTAALWIAFVVSAAVVPAATHQPISGAEATVGVDPTCHRVRARDDVAHAALGLLRHASLLADEMLAKLCASPHVMIRISASPTLLRETRSSGQARFHVVNDGLIVGYLTFDSAQSPERRQLRMLAHELAHAVELAALPKQTSTRALGTLLMAHVGRHLPWWPPRTLETAFAVNAEERVAWELQHGRDTRIGILARLLDEHGIGLGSDDEDPCC